MKEAGSAGLEVAALARKCSAFLKGALRFAGPAVLVSVGYIDPGNWATDLEGGSRFGYRLLWVLIASSLIAVLLQVLSARLGIVSGKNLAQACRAVYSPRVNVTLWVLAEIGIIACDSAEVVGSALALNLLFGLPLVLGAVLTVLDVLVVLVLQHRRLAVLELCIAGLLLVIATCLGVEVWLVRPSVVNVAAGLVPALPPHALYTAIAILGATVMPHNLYLQSALVEKATPVARRSALRRSWISTSIALNLALILNMAILMLSAQAFASRGMAITDLRDAHHFLSPLLGSSVASVLFAVGLLCSGQSATVTGTLAGQVVMEGFVQTRLSPVLRRGLTRCSAVVPALLVLLSFGDRGTTTVLIGSQVVLSLQLPFAIVPLLRLTSSKAVMREAPNGILIRCSTWACALGVCAANATLLYKSVLDLHQASALSSDLLAGTAIAGALFLFWIALVPLHTSETEELASHERTGEHAEVPSIG